MSSPINTNTSETVAPSGVNESQKKELKKKFATEVNGILFKDGKAPKANDTFYHRTTGICYSKKDANRGNPSNYVYRNNFINQDARTAVAKYIKDANFRHPYLDNLQARSIIDQTFQIGLKNGLSIEEVGQSLESLAKATGLDPRDFNKGLDLKNDTALAIKHGDIRERIYIALEAHADKLNISNAGFKANCNKVIRGSIRTFKEEDRYQKLLATAQSTQSLKIQAPTPHKLGSIDIDEGSLTSKYFDSSSGQIKGKIPADVNINDLFDPSKHLNKYLILQIQDPAYVVVGPNRPQNTYILKSTKDSSGKVRWQKTHRMGYSDTMKGNHYYMPASGHPPINGSFKKKNGVYKEFILNPKDLNGLKALPQTVQKSIVKLSEL